MPKQITHTIQITFLPLAKTIETIERATMLLQNQASFDHLKPFKILSISHSITPNKANAYSLAMLMLTESED